MVATTMVTKPRPNPAIKRKYIRHGTKKKWLPRSFRFSPELWAFLQQAAAEEDVDVSYLVVELAEQYRAFKTAQKKVRR